MRMSTYIGNAAAPAFLIINPNFATMGEIESGGKSHPSKKLINNHAGDRKAVYKD